MWNMRKTKIVATVSPWSGSEEMLGGLAKVGVNVFRLNFSHGTQEEYEVLIGRLRRLGTTTAIMLDTKGPEIRTGEIRGSLQLEVGNNFTLTVDTGIYEDSGKISVNYAAFMTDVDVGDTIILDGIMTAKALRKTERDIVFEVVEGSANITTKRHINLFGKPVSLPTVTEKDWKDIEFGLKRGINMIALSFVRTAQDIYQVKNYCKAQGYEDVAIIAKVENFESTQNLESIVEASDGIMVARGDLACEVPFSKIPGIQKDIIAICSTHKKPVIVATQMLLSMVDNVRPTRAEISDVANAVFDGADAVMTSEETTKGKFPINCIKVMAQIVTDAELDVYGTDTNLVDADVFSTELLTSADALAVLDKKSDWVMNLAAARLNLPLLFFTSEELVARNQQLTWGVKSHLISLTEDWLKNIQLVESILVKDYPTYKKVAFFFKIDNNTTIQVRAV
jgi:pyruvate kinase